MRSTRNVLIGGSRRAAITVPRAALRCDVFFRLYDQRTSFTEFDFLLLRAYPPHHRGRSLSHPQRKANSTDSGNWRLDGDGALETIISHHPDTDVQLFETPFGSLVVVVLLFIFFSLFLFTSESELFWVSFLVFHEFSTCRTRAFCVVSFQPTKNIPSFLFLSFFHPMFPSASLSACLPLSPSISSSLLLFACRRSFPSLSLGLRPPSQSLIHLVASCRVPSGPLSLTH
jgi:hypothetical protein